MPCRESDFIGLGWSLDADSKVQPDSRTLFQLVLNYNHNLGRHCPYVTQEAYHFATRMFGICPQGLEKSWGDLRTIAPNAPGWGRTVYSAISSVMTKNFWLGQWKVKADLKQRIQGNRSRAEGVPRSLLAFQAAGAHLKAGLSHRCPDFRHSHSRLVILP